MNDFINPGFKGDEVPLTMARFSAEGFIREQPDIDTLPLPDRITHVMLHRSDAEFNFLHESAIVHHKERFYAAWNNSPRAESQRGTVVRWLSADDDFTDLTGPQAIAPPLDHPTTIWESVQLLSFRDKLWAFVGQVHSQPRIPEESGGAMIVFQLDEAAGRWSEINRIDGFHPLNRPQLLEDGSWIMGGQYNLKLPRVAVSRGDDLCSWDVMEIPSTPENRINWAETSLIASGRSVTAHIRSELPILQIASSSDGGRIWGPIRPTNLPMASSKTCAGLLSTGQRFLTFNMKPQAEGAGSRDILAVAVSAPGEETFSRVVPIRNGRSPRIGAGADYASQWSYPSVEEHSGKVYVSYSVSKADCCLSILPLREFAAE